MAASGRAVRPVPSAGRPGVTPVLGCPHCRAALCRDGGTWQCANGHSFDVAHHGYVNLLGRSTPHVGDTPAMLDARAATLAAGHLDVLTDTVVQSLPADLPDGIVVEVGAGTAHHLGRVLAATGRAGVAIDVSKAAARRAARTSPAITSVVADVWGPWPLLDEVAAAVLHVFAPRNVGECHRTLVPGGVMVVTVPSGDHLRELVGPLGLLGTHADGGAAAQHPGLVPLSIARARAVRRLSRPEVANLVGMGPNAHHIDADTLRRRIGRLGDVVEVTVDVEVVALRKAP